MAAQAREHTTFTLNRNRLLIERARVLTEGPRRPADDHFSLDAPLIVGEVIRRVAPLPCAGKVRQVRAAGTKTHPLAGQRPMPAGDSRPIGDRRTARPAELGFLQCSVKAPSSEPPPPKHCITAWTASHSLQSWHRGPTWRPSHQARALAPMRADPSLPADPPCPKSL